MGALFSPLMDSNRVELSADSFIQIPSKLAKRSRQNNKSALLGDCVNEAGDKFHPMLPMLGLKGAPFIPSLLSSLLSFFSLKCVYHSSRDPPSLSSLSASIRVHLQNRLPWTRWWWYHYSCRLFCEATKIEPASGEDSFCVCVCPSSRRVSWTWWMIMIFGAIAPQNFQFVFYGSDIRVLIFRFVASEHHASHRIALRAQSLYLPDWERHWKRERGEARASLSLFFCSFN